MLTHMGVPASRAGTPTERQASISRIDSPVQLAKPVSIDSAGLWSAFFRPVEYLTLTSLKIFSLRRCAASAGVLQSAIRGAHFSCNILRQPSRVSLTEA